MEHKHLLIGWIKALDPAFYDSLDNWIFIRADSQYMILGQDDTNRGRDIDGLIVQVDLMSMGVLTRMSRTSSSRS